MISFDEFDYAIDTLGYAVFPAVVSKPLVDAMRNGIHSAYQNCRDIQMRNGIGEGMEHTVHHLPAHREKSWLDYLETMAVAPYISRFFDGKPYVLNSMGGNLNPPSAQNYASGIHRDIRSYSNDRLMLNTLVALDPLTKDNGGTWLLPGSHRMPNKPSDGDFDKDAIQISAPSGSVVMWDARLWHCAGRNRTTLHRRIITPIFTRPFYRPEFDYCRALGGGAQFSETLRQILGFNSRIPATMDQFYQPKADRYYKGDQG